MNRQQRRVKKHPLVRLIRGVMRLLRVIFRSRPTARLQPIESSSAVHQVEMDRREILAQERELAERYITLGELLARVEWQSPAQLELTSATSAEPRLHDVSLN